MAIKTAYSNFDEEFLFEEFAAVSSYQDGLVKLKNIFEKILRTKLLLCNIPFIRLVLLCSERYSITQEQLRTLIFLNNTDNVFETADEFVYDYILFQSRQLLEKWLKNPGLIPPIFYKINSFDRSTDGLILSRTYNEKEKTINGEGVGHIQPKKTKIESRAACEANYKNNLENPRITELPHVLARVNYLKVYVVSVYSPDESKKYARIFCKTVQGENIMVILLQPWDEFCINKSFSYGGLVGFYNLKYGEKENVFICDKNTLMVLSPDLILDVTDIKSSVGNMNDYIISRFCCTKNTNPKQVTGNIVNKILDEMLLVTENKDEECNEPFLINEINKFKLQLALAGAAIQDIYKDVKYHIENIIKSGLIDEIKSSDTFSIEPTFISTEFGISGRIDVLSRCMIDSRAENSDITEFSNDDKIEISCYKNKIIELKTGKPKDFGVWEQDEVQTALYSLMLQNKKSDISNKVMIFYSRDNNNPYRELNTVYPYSYLRNMRVRNEMIAFDRKLAALNFDSFNDLLDKISNSKSSKLLETSIDRLRNLKLNLDKSSIKNILMNYAAEFISFCERERYFQKIEFASIWTKTDFQKREEFKLLGPLKVESSDFAHSVIEFSVSANESKFREGDICLIYDRNKKISDQQVFKGTIKTISKNRVVVVLRNAGAIRLTSGFIPHVTKGDEADAANVPQWYLENDYIDVSMRKLIWALIDFLAIDERKQKLILGLEQPTFTENNSYTDTFLNSSGRLTQKQKEAIHNAVNANDYYLIQGPPGTGKTTLLTYLVKELITSSNFNHEVKDEGETLLVTAFTNRAVDEMINKFITETGMTDSIVRLGGEFSTDYPEYTVQNIIKDIPDNEVLECLKKRKVFFGTIAAVSYHEILQCIQFTTSIIDEASQIIEPEALSVILKTKKFILVGDEKQLPPVVSQLNSDLEIEQMTTDIKCLNDIGITKLDNSLFERLVRAAKNNNWNSCTLLDTQFRMNENLFRFANSNFYSSELQSGEKNSQLTTEFLEKRYSKRCVVNDKPFEFFNIVALGAKKKNKKEADTLVRLLEEYYLQNRKKKLGYSFGVIAPFRAQVSYIHQELLARDIQDVKVDTVERFQGGEKDIIFISFTAYNYSQISQIQSMQNFGDTLVDRKLNVAVTRAKRKLIMFGNAKLLEKNTIFNKLISFCKAEDCFYL